MGLAAPLFAPVGRGHGPRGLQPHAQFSPPCLAPGPILLAGAHHLLLGLSLGYISTHDLPRSHPEALSLLLCGHCEGLRLLQPPRCIAAVLGAGGGGRSGEAERWSRCPPLPLLGHGCPRRLCCGRGSAGHCWFSLAFRLLYLRDRRLLQPRTCRFLWHCAGRHGARGPLERDHVAGGACLAALPCGLTFLFLCSAHTHHSFLLLRAGGHRHAPDPGTPPLGALRSQQFAIPVAGRRAGDLCPSRSTLRCHPWLR
mmetsp:Transcript_79259/g.169838  ORF Transcript_79259/g.169838 Transcript_79259/m.169838 type:complete len:255 (+) Transcript_79259:2893-3657(+)